MVEPLRQEPEAPKIIRDLPRTTAHYPRQEPGIASRGIQVFSFGTRKSRGALLHPLHTACRIMAREKNSPAFLLRRAEKVYNILMKYM